MSDANDLTVLTQTEETITLRGKTMTINRIRMRQLPKVLELAQPMAQQLFIKAPGKNQPKPKGTLGGFDIGTLVMKHGEELVQLIAEIQSYNNEGVTADWVGDLEIDEVITLTGRVLEVNLDFFIQRVLPALSGALAAVNHGIQVTLQGGSTPSQS